MTGKIEQASVRIDYIRRLGEPQQLLTDEDGRIAVIYALGTGAAVRIWWRSGVELTHLSWIGQGPMAATDYAENTLERLTVEYASYRQTATLPLYLQGKAPGRRASRGPNEAREEPRRKGPPREQIGVQQPPPFVGIAQLNPLKAGNTR